MLLVEAVITELPLGVHGALDLGEVRLAAENLHLDQAGVGMILDKAVDPAAKNGSELVEITAELVVRDRHGYPLGTVAIGSDETHFEDTTSGAHAPEADLGIAGEDQMGTSGNRLNSEFGDGGIGLGLIRRDQRSGDIAASVQSDEEVGLVGVELVFLARSESRSKDEFELLVFAGCHGHSPFSRDLKGFESALFRPLHKRPSKIPGKFATPITSYERPVTFAPRLRFEIEGWMF